jgi:tetraacyldisaccharide 4'-kinase
MNKYQKKYRLLLYPLSVLYELIVRLRNKFFDLGILHSTSFDIPVISVGNISIGGTGKTPHSEYILNLFRNDFLVALLSRGYGRKTKGFILADENSTSSQIGDEPRQIKKKFKSITVAVDEKRVRGINKLIETQTLNVIVLDDAFQHRYVNSGINILLIDYNNQNIDDHLLPMGNLREPASQKDRANIIIITKTPIDVKPINRRIIEKNLAIFPYQSLYFTGFSYGNLINIYSNKEEELNNNIDVLLITAIANSKPLLDYLTEKVRNVKELKFRDHHSWTLKDFETIKTKFDNFSHNKKIIITTEKDSVRFIDSEKIDVLQNIPIYYIPIQVIFLDLEQEKQFKKQLIDYVKKNKRSNKLH